MALEKEPGRGSREKAVFFVRSGKQEELRRYLSEFCEPLLATDVFVSRQEGDIYYISWRDLPKERILPQKFIQISETGPSADIYAPGTRYSELKEMVICQIKSGGGGVETAIRAFDHILEGVKGKEIQQAQAVGERAYQLLDLFTTRSLKEVTPEDFVRAEKETRDMLARQKIDPGRLINSQKQAMVHFLLKGQTGKDSRERLNWLVSAGALTAAHRLALERQYGLGPVAVKFVRGREALILTRELCRTVFEDVARRLRSEGSPPSQVMINDPELVIGMLGILVTDLENFVSVKPYKTAGSEAASNLVLAQDLIDAGRKHEAAALLIQVRGALLSTLNKYRYVYPQEKTY